MAGDIEQVGNRIMDGDEVVQIALRLEALHDPFSSSDGLVGILCPIVQAFVLTVFDTWHDLSLCSVVRPELVCDYHLWRMPLALQQRVYQALGCLGIATTLHHHVEDETILIHGVPEAVLLAADRNDGLIEVPLSTRPAERRRISLAKVRPNFAPHSRTV